VATKTLAGKYSYLLFIPVALLLNIAASQAADSNASVTSDKSQTTSDPAENIQQDAGNSDADINLESTSITTAKGTQPFNSNAKFPQDNLNTIPEDENQMRLLEVYARKYKVEDLLVTYQKDDMIFIPLEFFSELTGLAIKTDPESGIGEGFIFREDRTFYLNVKRGELTIEGKLIRFNKQQAAIRQFDDIYIDSNLLGQWLSMELDIDLFASRMKIISKQPLPLELRKQREERIKLIRSRLPSDRGYPRQEFPHKDWSYPMINQTARMGIYRGADGDMEGTFGYATYATADFIGMESSWYLAGNEHDIVEDARVTFGKRDPTGSLLGNMRATEYAFGHINEPSIDLITAPLEPQPGILVSNYPLTRQLQYDSHNFRGDLPPGWEVELYRNNELLNYAMSGENGQYSFDDVPLLYGTNYFRLVFYGPQGQQREENYNFTLDRSLSEPGKHYYRAIISQDQDFGKRALAQYNFGISKSFSVAASFASVPLDKTFLITEPEENHNYISGGVRGFYNSLFYRSDIILDMQSGSAIDWAIQSRIGSVILNLGETYFHNDYISEEFPENYLPIERRTKFSIDTAIVSTLLPRIPINFEMERKQYTDNLIITRYSNRISMQQHGLSISNTLNRNEQTGLETIDNGNFQISRRAYGYNFRGSMSYQLTPNSELSATTLTMDGIKFLDYHVATGVSHIVQNNTNELFFNMSRSHGEYALGLNSRYGTGGVITVDLTLSVGLGHEPRTNTWNPEYRPIASQGSLSAQVYLDANRNGKKDADEKGIEGAKIKINGSNINRIADSNGIIYVTGIEPYREMDIDIALETLNDPLWQPAFPGKRVSLRPGYTAQIDFPIIITGEIDGTAFVQFGAEQREVSGVVIELLNLQGKLIQTTKTAYDGFYLLSKIPAGKYQLRVSREQTDSLNLLRVPPTFVVIDPKDPIVNGMDFVLQKRSTIPPGE